MAFGGNPRKPLEAGGVQVWGAHPGVDDNRDHETNADGPEPSVEPTRNRPPIMDSLRVGQPQAKQRAVPCAPQSAPCRASTRSAAQYPQWRMTRAGCSLDESCLAELGQIALESATSASMPTQHYIGRVRQATRSRQEFCPGPSCPKREERRPNMGAQGSDPDEAHHGYI